MSDEQGSNAELLQTVLQPLFDDFQHWFGRTKTLLEQESLSFMDPQEQNQLLQNVTQSLQEVTAAQSLFQATEGQAGVDTAVLMTWHQLVTQCWKILIQSRQSET